jgi:hypothetical protein
MLKNFSSFFPERRDLFVSISVALPDGFVGASVGACGL